MSFYDHRVATRQTAATRAKDSDRNDTCSVLDSALADGQLSMEEHRQRVATATNAATLGDLQSLVSDLQNENAPVQLPNLKPVSKMSVAAGSRGALGVRVAMAAVLVLLGIGIGWGVYGNTSSPLSFTSDPGAKADGVAPVVLTPPRQLQSLGGMTGLVEQMKQRFGDTMGYHLLVYPDYGSLDRVDPNDNRRKITYDYRGGWGDGDDPSAIDNDDRLVDFGTMDVKALVGVLRGAPDTLGIKRGRREEHLHDHRPVEGSVRRRAVGHDVRLERLRQRLHPDLRRRHRQADQLPVLSPSCGRS